MPETEPKPKLIELVTPGQDQGWKAVLKNGKPAVVHEIPVGSAEAAAAVPRLQRLYEHRHPALSPVLAWGTDTNGVWVAVEPNEGTPLGNILQRGPLTPPAAAALGTAVLSGVAALHEAGIAMGGFSAAAVRVTSNGDVRLAGHPAAAVRGAPSQSDLRADVRSCGMAVCAAFGVDPAGAPAPPNIPPGLVVTMRSMASGAMGPAADRAQGALREMASALLAPDRQVAAQSELALRAGGREVPKITPFLPAAEQAAAAVAPPPPTPPAPAPAPVITPPSPVFTPPARREETPIRTPVSYDAPERPVQTYPSMPAYTAPPTPAPAWAPIAEPGAPAEPVEPKPAEPKVDVPAVPTWADAPPTPPRAPLPWETVTPAASTTSPPAPAEAEPAVPVAEEPRSAFDSVPPPPARAEAPPAPPPPSPPEPRTVPTWSTVEAPVWKPGEVKIPIPGAPETTPAPTPAYIAPSSAASAPAPTVPPTPAPIRPVPTPARKPSVPRPPSGGEPERPRWLVPAAIAVVVLLLIGIFGFVLLHGRGGGNPVAHGSPSAKPSHSPTSNPTTPPSTTPQAVPVYAPSSATPITRVQFCTTANPCPIAQGIAPETATSCDLSSCEVEVALYFSTPQHVPVHYNLKFFNRCTGETTDLPGPSAYTPPNYAVVIPGPASGKWPVSIPSGVKSGALVAVADQPATAASAPLLLGADSCA